MFPPLHLVVLLGLCIPCRATFWTQFSESYRVELPESKDGEEEVGQMFRELDEGLEPCVHEMDLYQVPPQTVHPMHQKFYIDKHQNPNAGSKKTQKWTSISKQSLAKAKPKTVKERQMWFVNAYKVLAVGKGEVAVLVRGLVRDHVGAKQMLAQQRDFDATELRGHFRQARQLINGGRPVDLASVGAFPLKTTADKWALIKASAKFALGAFKGDRFQDGEKRKRLLRLLNTFAAGENVGRPYDRVEAKPKRRRRKRQLTLLVLAGAILAVVGLICFLSWAFFKKPSADGKPRPRFW